MNQKTKSKFLAVLNIIMVFILLAIPVYAFIWAPIQANQGIDVELGTEDALVIGDHGWLNGDEYNVLIPLTATATRADEVKLLTYEVTVNLEAENDLTGLTVVATIDNATDELLVTAVDTEVELVNGEAIFTFMFELNVTQADNFDFNQVLQVTINFTLGE